MFSDCTYQESYSGDQINGRAMWHVWGRGGLMGRTDVKRPLGRPRHRKENDTKMGLQEI